MAKYQNKTQPTGVDSRDFIASVEPVRRREEGLVLLDFFDRVTGMPAVMWGPSIVGFGRYRYKYKSGHGGEWPLTGFSPRKAGMTVYVMSGFSDKTALLAKLGKHRHSKSCLYLNKLADIDLDVLHHIVDADLAWMRERYETWEK